MESITLGAMVDQDVPLQVVLATTVSPKDFLSVTMPTVVRNRAADEAMIRTLVQSGWTHFVTVGRVVHFERPHVFKTTGLSAVGQL